MDRLVYKGDGKSRCDVYLTEKTGFTRSRIRRLIEDGFVTADGVPVTKCGAVIKENAEVEILVEDPVVISAEPEDIPIDIVYEDADFVVVNKKQGMVTHPCAGTPSGTLVNALVHCVKDLSGINGVFRPGIVHRLDKDTSGLIVVAKNDASHLSLASQIEKKTAARHYLALVEGNIKEDTGVIDKPIARSRVDRKKMAIAKEGEGRRAVTNYFVRERFGGRYTLVEFHLSTGRTHQIRVHAKSIGHPVVGDPVYNGKDEFRLNGQLLHAFRLSLTHPTTGERMDFFAPLPDYFERVLSILRK